MVIGRLSCGRFAPGSGRVVVVRSLRSWLPTREGPLEPLSWHRRLLARPPAESSLLPVQGPQGGPASKRLRRRATSGKPHDPCLFRRGCRTKRQPAAKPLARTRTQARARRARGCKRPLEKTVFSKALLQPPPDMYRPDQNSIIGFAMNRSTLSWCPSWFQHSGCAMFTFVRG